jgi:hypothetical protein
MMVGFPGEQAGGIELISVCFLEMGRGLGALGQVGCLFTFFVAMTTTINQPRQLAKGGR